MTTALTLTTRPIPTGAVLTVAGDLDHDSAGQLRAAVDAIVLRPGDLLTVDLTDLAYCDSTGITALIAARNHTHAHGADIALTAVPSTTLRILGILGLDQLFPIYPATEADA